MGLFNTLIFSIFAAGSAAKDAITSLQVQQEVHEIHGIKYYIDGKFRKFLLDGTEIVTDYDRIVTKKDGRVIWDRYKEIAKENKRRAVSNGMTKYNAEKNPRCRGNWLAVKEEKTGKFIAKIERRFVWYDVINDEIVPKIECRKFYFENEFRVDDCRPTDTTGDGVVILEKEFEEIRQVERKFMDVCIDIIDKDEPNKIYDRIMGDLGTKNTNFYADVICYKRHTMDEYKEFNRRIEYLMEKAKEWRDRESERRLKVYEESENWK